jgi:formylglycine-generating enzyme required for sulfatase activity
MADLRRLWWCPKGVSDSNFGRGSRPVINVTWDQAKHYVAWLRTMTRKPYRLLSEAEYEYAARAGTHTAYPWGDEIGKGNANCNECGSQWDGQKTAPVNSFAPNQFGLYNMVGNVWEWVEDCAHENYRGAPEDGSAWLEEGCPARVFRGGSWFGSARNARIRTNPRVQRDRVGFRVARTLTL